MYNYFRNLSLLKQDIIYSEFINLGYNVLVIIEIWEYILYVYRQYIHKNLQRFFYEISLLKLILFWTNVKGCRGFTWFRI